VARLVLRKHRPGGMRRTWCRACAGSARVASAQRSAAQHTGWAGTRVGLWGGVQRCRDCRDAAPALRAAHAPPSPRTCA
jgi:hypothetical protein